MAEAKQRILAIERIGGAAQPLSGLAALDSEFCFLQLRRRPNNFRRRLCDALEELQAPDVRLANRVDGFELTADKKWLTVRMARWG